MTRRHRRRAAAAATAAAVLGLAVVPIARGLGGPATPSEAAEPPHFVEEAAAAGVQHVYEGDWPFLVGGGVAAFDCDADGRPDLFLAGGSAPAALYRNASAPREGLRFTHLPGATTDLRDVTGAYPIDLDADGHLDLVVLRRGENVLLRGVGDCRFERANERLDLDGGDALTTAFSATWEAEATLPTLVFGNYVDGGDDGERFDRCHDNHLLRPRGPSAATYASPEPLSPGWCALSVLFSDWDRDGGADLRISNDRHYNRDGAEQLWAVAPGEPPRPYTREDGWQRLEIWGMGIASHDVTGDGYPEIFLTSQGDNKLQTLAGGADRPEYEDIAIRRGVTAHRPFTGADVHLPSTAWHAEFQDANNDGFVDLFVAKGNVDAMPDHATEDPNNLLLGQPDGTFVEAADRAGVASTARGRGAALVDLDLDGMLDLVVVDRGADVEVWRNVGWGDATRLEPMGNWVAVRPRQAGGNRDAVGAWLEVRIGDRTVRREVTIGGGHAGGQLGWIHVGLGPADRAELRVVWPDGEVGPWQRIEANGFAVVERGAAQPEAWQPPGR